MTTTSTPDGLIAFGVGFIVFLLLLGLFMLVATWRVYDKAGEPGWKCLIPFYNTWVLAEMAGRPGWWGLVGLTGLIPIVGIFGTIAALVLTAIICADLAVKFGKSDGWGVGLLWLLPFIGWPILAFGPARYTSYRPPPPMPPSYHTPPPPPAY